MAFHPCPKCGQPVCSDCGEHQPGQVGEAVPDGHVGTACSPTPVEPAPGLLYLVHGGMFPGEVAIGDFGKGMQEFRSLIGANVGYWQQGFFQNQYGACLMNGWKDGVKIRFPKAWIEGLPSAQIVALPAAKYIYRDNGTPWLSSMYGQPSALQSAQAQMMAKVTGASTAQKSRVGGQVGGRFDVQSANTSGGRQTNAPRGFGSTPPTLQRDQRVGWSENIEQPIPDPYPCPEGSHKDKPNGPCELDPSPQIQGRIRGQVGAVRPSASAAATKVTLLWNSLLGEDQIVVIAPYGEAGGNEWRAVVVNEKNATVVQMLALAVSAMSLYTDTFAKTVAAIKARWNTPMDLYYDYNKVSGAPDADLLHGLKMLSTLSRFVAWLTKKLSAPVSVSRGFTMR